jgi:hypothetical protein
MDIHAAKQRLKPELLPADWVKGERWKRSVPRAVGPYPLQPSVEDPPRATTDTNSTPTPSLSPLTAPLNPNVPVLLGAAAVTALGGDFTTFPSPARIAEILPTYPLMHGIGLKS